MSSHNHSAVILGAEILRGVYREGENLSPEPDLIRFQLSPTILRAAMVASFTRSERTIRRGRRR